MNLKEVFLKYHFFGGEFFTFFCPIVPLHYGFILNMEKHTPK